MKINLVTFNHIVPGAKDIRNIDDQIKIIIKVFSELQIDLKITNMLDPNTLNILIEGFDESHVNVINKFCIKYNKKICVIMTEHLSLKNDELYYGTFSLTNRDYIKNIDQRVFSLLSLSENIMSYFTLGELPLLSDIQKILFTNEVYRINYPKIKPCYDVDFTQASYDIGFTGNIIPYREQVIQELQKKYKVFKSKIVSSNDERLINTRKSKAIISIPQSEEWEWISPMRFMYNLEIGMPSVHLGKGDNTEFYNKILSWVSIDEAIQNPKIVYEKQIKVYNNLDLHSDRFKSFLDIWNILEND